MNLVPGMHLHLSSDVEQHCKTAYQGLSSCGWNSRMGRDFASFPVIVKRTESVGLKVRVPAYRHPDGRDYWVIPIEAVESAFFPMPLLDATFTTECTEWTASQWSTFFTNCRYAPQAIRTILHDAYTTRAAGIGAKFDAEAYSVYHAVMSLLDQLCAQEGDVG